MLEAGAQRDHWDCPGCTSHLLSAAPLWPPPINSVQDITQSMSILQNLDSDPNQPINCVHTHWHPVYKHFCPKVNSNSMSKLSISHKHSSSDSFHPSFPLEFVILSKDSDSGLPAICRVLVWAGSKNPFVLAPAGIALGHSATRYGLELVNSF